MTLHNARSITGLYIIPRDRGTHWAAIGCRENDEGWLVYAPGPTQSEALDALVRENWRKVCQDVAMKQGWRCWKCGRAVALSGHHKKLRSQGRDDRPENVRMSCRDCHNQEHESRAVELSHRAGIRVL